MDFAFATPDQWLLDDGRTLLFEYSEQALAEGLNLSPRHLPLSTQSLGGFPMHQWRLPGLITDALPDGWGLLLTDRLFRQQGGSPKVWRSKSTLCMGRSQRLVCQFGKVPEA